jgi:hypothetical protein
MIYAKLLVVAESREEMMRIIGKLYNARRREFANNGIDPPSYDVKETEKTGGRFIINEQPRDFFEKGLQKDLDDMS